MRTRSLIPTIAAALLITGLRIGVAEADDQIKAGKWEFSVLVPGATQIPSGMENQPEYSWDRMADDKPYRVHQPRRDGRSVWRRERAQCRSLT